MPLEPSISASGVLKVDQAETEIMLDYKRAMTGEVVLGQGSGEIEELVYKRSLSADIETGSGTAELDPSFKRVVSGEILHGNAKGELTASVKRSCAAEVPIGSASPQWDLDFKRAIAADISVDESEVSLVTQVQQSVKADLTIGNARSELKFLYRKFQFPAPTIELWLAGSLNNKRLSGSGFNAGDSVVVEFILRGYHLDVLLTGSGPYLQFILKKNMSDPDVSAIASKSSSSIPSGIFFRNDSLKIITTNEIGVIQEISGQVRLFPGDTKGYENKTIWYEIEYIDPIAEVFTLEIGSFELYKQVRR